MLTCGEKAISLFVEMERVGHVTPSSLRPLESLHVPEDMELLLTHMDSSHGKPTASRLKLEANAIADQRWWQWCLMHPALPEALVHPSRSMLMLFVLMFP